MGFGDILGKKQTTTGFGSVLGGTSPVSGGFGGFKADLETVKGLESVAQRTGMGEEAQKILATKGEEPKKIYSGGFVMDIFDTLNALQYGVTGILKGKSFAEGVKTRQSFSDKDALGDYGIPGMIGGIALDIAVDPLTYIAPYTIIKKIPGLVKGAKAVGEAVKSTKIGQTMGRALIYRFGQDPVYQELAERSIKNIAVGSQNVLDLARPLTKLDSATQVAIANARKAGELEKLPQELLEKAKPAFDELDRLGKEAVDVGLLKAETYAENVGSYIARLYKTKEIPKGIVGKVKTFFERKPQRIDLSRFKKRTDIPEEVRDAMGEILEAGYPTAKALVQLTQAVEKAKFFKLAGSWAKDTVEEGFEKLPDVKTLGNLAGKAVPKWMFDDIQEIIRPRDFNLGKKLVAGFKFSKVILNPATHARNIMSNFLLNNFEGLSPARMDIYGEAAKELVTKGKWYQEAQKVGLGLNTFASRELKDILTGTENAGFIKRFGMTTIDKLSDIYQKEEEFAKLAQYIFQRKKGLIPDEAWKIAEKATFNYAQVTPFIRRVRESIFGYPFITFTYKATPQVVKTIATKPTKISNIGKIKQAIESQSDVKELTAERASEPEWVRDGFYVKLPIKDKEGRSAYLDLTYILPFGDLISGQLIQRDIERETGLKESVPEALLSKAPFLNVVKELAKNQDFYGNKIFRESDDVENQLGDVFRHLVKTYSPPLLADQIPGGYRKGDERKPAQWQQLFAPDKDVEVGGVQSRTRVQEFLKLVGIKIQPVDLETQVRFAEQEKERALRTLLGEEGKIAEFTRPFIPKEQEIRGRLFK